jgi:hypothetical protein
MKKVGGVILEVSKLKNLLNTPDGPSTDPVPVAGLAIKATGRETGGAHSARVEIYALYPKGGTFYYKKDVKYTPGNGRTFEGRNTPTKVSDYMFEHYKTMDTKHDGKCFCFAFIKEEEIAGIMEGKNKLFLSSIKHSRRGTDVFSFVLQDNASDDEPLLTAPCPPFWKPGAPSEGLISEKSAESNLLLDWEINALKELAKTLCDDITCK